MTALDWLRRQKAARRPLATGGIVTPAAGPVLEPGPAPSVIPRTAQRAWIGDREMPVGTRVEITMRQPDVTTTADEIAAALRSRPRPAPNGGNCGCVPRYSRCYCPDRDNPNGS